MANRDSNAAQALQAVPFFANLQGDELEEISGRVVPRRFASGQIIFHLGDPGGLLYVIRRGRVKLSHTTREGQEIVLAILGPGDFFGELALLDDSPRSATSESMGPSEMWTLHREDFMHYINENPTFSLHVMKTLAQHIRRLNNQLADIFFLDLPGRLARTLLNLADQYGRQSPDGTVIDLVLTQTDLAEMTGATRVSVNKAIGRFRRSDWIQVDGRRITIVDRAALESLIAMS